MKGDVQTLDLVVVAFIVSALVVWAAGYAQTYLVGWVGQRALADLRLQIFRHLQGMPVGFYERRPAGVLISRMTNDVEALDSLVTDTVDHALPGVADAHRLDRRSCSTSTSSWRCSPS